MEIDSYLLFIGGSILLCISPGPDMIYLLSRSIAQGKRSGVVAALGINAGAYTHLVAAILGLSAILATSTLAFTVLKWVGAAYLIYIGIQAIRSHAAPLTIDKEGKRHRLKSIFWQGYWSDVLNPKVAIFYLAFLPQFIDPSSPNQFSILLFLGITVNVIGIIVNLILVYASTSVTNQLRNNKSISSTLNKAMGGIFIALGVRLAGEKI